MSQPKKPHDIARIRRIVAEAKTLGEAIEKATRARRLREEREKPLGIIAKGKDK